MIDSTATPQRLTPHSSKRLCPNCNTEPNSLITSLTAQEVADANWSYRDDFATLLKIGAEETFDIVRCNECQFIYTGALPDAEFLHTLYDRVIDLNSDSSRLRYSHDYARRLSYLSTLARLHSDQINDLKMLDYGAGFGQTSRLLAAQGIDVVAFETSALRRNDLAKIPIHVADSKTKIIEQGPYSVVICDNVLEHVPNPKAELAFFKSVIKRGGILFISVPSYEPTELDRLISSQHMSLNPWEHLNYFDVKHLDAMTEEFDWVPLSAAASKSNIDIGLRPEPQLTSRLKNACASAIRLAKFAVNGKSLETVNCRFYRLRVD